jgi:hypothetical protein
LPPFGTAYRSRVELPSKAGCGLGEASPDLRAAAQRRAAESLRHPAASGSLATALKVHRMLRNALVLVVAYVAPCPEQPR